MLEHEQQKIKALEKKIKSCTFWYKVSGALGALSLASVFLSILIGNRMLGFCAVSWILGSFFAFLSSATKSQREELRDEVFAIESLSRLEKTLKTPAHRSVETDLGFIGMN